MAFVIWLGGAFWLALIAAGLWKAALGLKALAMRQATLRNVRFRVTRLGPVRIEAPPTGMAGNLASGYGLLQLVCGLLIAGPLILVPLLGGGFPWTILLGPVVGFPLDWIGARIIKARAARADGAPPSL